MNKKRANAAKLLLLTITLCVVASTASNAYLVYAANGSLVVDLFTDKAPFDGRGANQPSDGFSYYLDPIVLHTLVTYNGEPRIGVLVSFEVTAPTPTLNQYRTAHTDQSGVATISFSLPTENVESIAFGEWVAFSSAAISGGYYGSDRLTFEVGYLITPTIKTVAPVSYPRPNVEKQDFVKKNTVGLEITLKSIAMNPKDVLLTINVYDALGQQIYGSLIAIKMPYGKLPIYQPFTIPENAAIGTAKILVNVFDKEPSLGGVPYCRETSATFNILLKDVAIMGASMSASELYLGEVLNIHVTVKNLGSTPETFNVTIYSNSSAIATTTVNSLGAGVAKTLDFAWNTSSASIGNYKITASASQVPEETNTINNHYVIGDLSIIPQLAPLNQRDLFIILWLITIFFLFALLALLLLRRRKKDESGTLEQMSYFM